MPLSINYDIRFFRVFVFFVKTDIPIRPHIAVGLHFFACSKSPSFSLVFWASWRSAAAYKSPSLSLVFWVSGRAGEKVRTANCHRLARGRRRTGPAFFFSPAVFFYAHPGEHRNRLRVFFRFFVRKTVCQRSATLLNDTYAQICTIAQPDPNYNRSSLR